MAKSVCGRCGGMTTHVPNGTGLAICAHCRERARVVAPGCAIPVLGTVDAASGRVEWDSAVALIAAVAGRG